MTRIQPMLDQLLLQHVQHVELDDHDVIVQHGVPAREGDVLQSLRRREHAFDWPAC